MNKRAISRNSCPKTAEMQPEPTGTKASQGASAPTPLPNAELNMEHPKFTENPEQCQTRAMSQVQKLQVFPLFTLSMRLQAATEMWQSSTTYRWRSQSSRSEILTMEIEALSTMDLGCSRCSKTGHVDTSSIKY